MVAELKVKCPRCEAILTQSYISEPPNCVRCGWEDYSYEEPKARKARNRFLGGTTHKLRYMGTRESPASNFVIDVELRHVPREDGRGGKMVAFPECPFCDDPSPMEQTSLSSKRKEIREERYRCPNGHRVRLMKNGVGYWEGWM